MIVAEVNERLEHIIKDELHLTNRQFARDMNIKDSYASHILLGDRGLSLVMLIKVCEVYNLDANWLLGLTHGDKGE